MNILNGLVAEGVGTYDLIDAIDNLPPGNYRIEFLANDGFIYKEDVDTTKDINGVGIAPILLALLGVGGVIAGWKVYEAATKVPGWLLVIGGASLVVLLADPILNLLIPSRKVSTLTN